MATVGREHCCPANRGSDGFERWGTTAMLPKCGATECIEEDFQGRIGTHFMQGFAFVLEDFLRAMSLLSSTQRGRAVHMLDQIPWCRQCLLLFDKSPGSGVGQMFDGLAAQYCPFSPS